MRPSCIVLVAMGLAALCVTGASGETLVLQDGRVVEGTIVARTAGKLYIKNTATGAMETIEESRVVEVKGDHGQSVGPSSSLQPTSQPKTGGPSTGTATQPKDATPTEADPLATPEALMAAVMAIRQNSKEPNAPKDPREMPNWGELTSLQQEQVISAYQEAKRTHAESLTNAASCRSKAEQELYKQFEGKKPSWVLEVDEVARRQDGAGYVLQALSACGYKVTAYFDEQYKEMLLKLKKYQSVIVTGQIDSWRIDSLKEPGIFDPRLSMQLGVLLRNAVISLPSEGQAKRFTEQGEGTAHIVYLIDSSGSTAQTLSGAKDRIMRCINQLRPRTSFHIIFWSDSLVVGPSATAVPATEDNKAAASRFMRKVDGSGSGKAIPALQRSFSLLRATNSGLRVIFLVSDGDFAGMSGGSTYTTADGRTLNGNEAVIQWLRDNNPKEEKKGLVHVNTVLFRNMDEEAKKVMETIAKENSGRFKLISTDE